MPKETGRTWDVGHNHICPSSQVHDGPDPVPWLVSKNVGIRRPSRVLRQFKPYLCLVQSTSWRAVLVFVCISCALWVFCGQLRRYLHLACAAIQLLHKSLLRPKPAFPHVDGDLDDLDEVEHKCLERKRVREEC